MIAGSASEIVTSSFVHPEVFDEIRRVYQEKEASQVVDSDSQGQQRKRVEWKILGERVCLKSWLKLHGLGISAAP